MSGRQGVLLGETRIGGASELSSLRQATREDEREAKHALLAARGAVVAEGGGGPRVAPRPPPGIYCAYGESIDAPLSKKMSLSEAEMLETQRSGSLLYRPASSPRRPAIRTTDIQRVEVTGRAVTSMGLADAVEAALGSVGKAEDEFRREERLNEPRLWSLVLRQCQISSLLPVAGLLDHLDGLVSLGLHEIPGLSLSGVERVLADARCLTSLAIRRCGVTRLPRLQSGSVEKLDLSDNAIEDTGGLETLFRLKELDLSGNNVRTLLGVRSLVPLGAGSLRSLNFDMNPLQNSPRYLCSCGSYYCCRTCRLDCPFLRQDVLGMPGIHTKG